MWLSRGELTQMWYQTSLISFAILAVLIPNFLVNAQEPRQGQGTEVSRYEEKRRKLNRNIVTIMGSQAKTSYTRMAQDMQNVLDDLQGNSIRILPILGRGGGQNFLDTLFLQGIDMGIMERDVIQNFKKKDPVMYGNIQRRLRYIVKLSNSEMHFFARHEIKKLEDLRGKKVSFYKPNSSSAQAITKILGACNIEVEKVHADTSLGESMLRSGEIMAIGRISGAPHGALVGLKPEDGHFLPLDEANLPPGCYEKLTEMYLPAFLKHNHYPQLIKPGEQIPTIANATLLTTYNFAPKSVRYKRVANFVNKFFNNINEFKNDTRHPKWKEINLAANIPGWTRFRAAQEWIDGRKTERPNVLISGDTDSMRTAFERVLAARAQTSGSQLSEEERRVLFEQFLEFWQSNNGEVVRR